ncbi:Electron transporter, putative [Theobroma cacao]|uniref:Electron transporter, putative n=1 Tax=Theobroma cacao TaxID=3641 RepID=A0A061G678_THECC|nr:Electron transporter, putative [Theobroma cacao]
MGCSASKRNQAIVDIYRPPPTSFAVFDINAIDEPWVKVEQAQQENQEKKPTHVPAVILEKLNTFETDAPYSWDEVSKALENLKPTLNNNNKKLPAPTSPPKPAKQVNKQQPRKCLTFHTLEELDAKLSSKPAANELRKTESMGKETGTKTKTKTTELNNPEPSKPAANELRKTESMRKETGTKTKTTELNNPEPPVPDSTGFKSVKENIFILRDRQEREKEERMGNYDKLMSKRDPLSQFPEMCPPGGADSVVIYTTSLRGVRRTFEDCTKVREIFEIQRVVFDERDVSLHGEFLNELRSILGKEASVPRVFVKGRYVGGVEEVSELDESGKLGKILNKARVEKGVGRQACGGCGGARFVPCLECGGSCKVVVSGDKRERCGKCNENGLVHCPACV